MDEKDVTLLREFIARLRELDKPPMDPRFDSRSLDQLIDWFTLRFSGPPL